MTVRVKVAIDPEPVFALVMGALNRAGHDWYTIARAKAPVSKGRDRKKPGTRSPTHAVRLVSTLRSTNGLTSAQVKRAVFLRERSSRQRAQILSNLTGYNASHQEAQLFRYSEGPMKGQAPEVLVVKGAQVRGAEVTHSGTLRDSIEVEPAQREGSVVTVVMRANAPYAHYVDEGFHHRGGKQVPGRHFAREPLYNIIIPNLRDGKYFEG